jgi:hypothetical protein
MNPDMVRWIMASCRSFFYERRNGIPLFFENTGPKTLLDAAGNPTKTYGEFRLEGPYFRQVNAVEQQYDIVINILVHTGINVTDSDEIERALGSFASIYQSVIPVYRYGNGIGDDQTFVGCLQLLVTKGDEVKVSRFGQANPDTRLAQASIDGNYRMKRRA